jgi:hypothetical protein
MSETEKKSGLKIEACAKGSKRDAKSKKNRIFVGGIPIDLVEGKQHPKTLIVTNLI